MATPNQFYDPVLPETYNWHINHSQQDGPTRPSGVSYEGRRGDLGVMATQGDDDPLEISLTGTILRRAQVKAFWRFRNKKNSFRYTDYDSQSYEVAMIGFEPSPRRVAWNPSDATMRFHVYDYTMTLLVLRIISGDLFDEGIEP